MKKLGVENARDNCNRFSFFSSYTICIYSSIKECILVRTAIQKVYNKILYHRGSRCICVDN